MIRAFNWFERNTTNFCCSSLPSIWLTFLRRNYYLISFLMNTKDSFKRLVSTNENHGFSFSQIASKKLWNWFDMCSHFILTFSLLIGVKSNWLYHHRFCSDRDQINFKLVWSFGVMIRFEPSMANNNGLKVPTQRAQSHSLTNIDQLIACCSTHLA